MFRRKLLINLLIIVICGTVAVSIPVIVNYQQKSSHAATEPTDSVSWTLVSEFVGADYLNKTDTYAVWQIYLKRGNTVFATWNNIYAAVIAGTPLYYDSEHLLLTPYGLCYRGLQTAEDYEKLHVSGYATYVHYQGQTCVLELP